MKKPSSLVLLVAIIFAAAGRSAAEFTNSFDDIARGSNVTLTWGGVQPQQYPLCIAAQLIEREKGGDGFSANAYRVNITTGASGTAHVWTGAPYPLPWVADGLYQLELRPMGWTGGDAPVLGRSPFFTILSSDSDGGVVGPAPSASAQATPAESRGGDDASHINKPVAIGLGVAIGVPSIAALVVVGWCFRRRQRRAVLEKTRLKRADFVIT
ncbi:uncharacterized protein B0T15DRAFT_128168 [Chaetomium strumarium]|uniref:Uncharacterized protein n=1 Tax=Chaetomium strumarium TaxID=1170767 RepID=A0AAJ0M4S9_9PEZI|nr:hypothetical protein B0T15DRAFT_128168 [Chaetomium strumarium]